MILKHYELKKINNKNNLLLFHGNNEGLKDESINLVLKNENKNEIFKYDQNEILTNIDQILSDILTRSLFEEKKIIIINRANNKILNFVEILYAKNIVGVKLIINSEGLDKKSKLRNFFEKKKECICIAFYPDNEQNLFTLANDFFRKKNILISRESINLLISKSVNNRKTLTNELKKIEAYTISGKKINSNNLTKIINLSENYNISELIDHCLAKNKQKIINILNENNFNNEDCIIIVRTFLNKAKQLLSLSKNYYKTKNIELVISSAKPPIFWKNKDIIIRQIYKWNPNSIRDLLIELNTLELVIKKNINSSINLVSDFIFEHTNSKTSNYP